MRKETERHQLPTQQKERVQMRRDGRGAAAGPPSSLPPPPPPSSQIQSQGSFGLGVTYGDGFPQSCGAAETARPCWVAACRGVRINSSTTTSTITSTSFLHSVRTGGCCCRLQACSSYRHRIIIPPLSSPLSSSPPLSSASQCAAVSADVLPPAPADAQNLTGQSLSVHKEEDVVLLEA
ncbi:hypothetical protein PAMA_003571 [Pampus argenteus]